MSSIEENKCGICGEPATCEFTFPDSRLYRCWPCAHTFMLDREVEESEPTIVYTKRACVALEKIAERLDKLCRPTLIGRMR